MTQAIDIHKAVDYIRDNAKALAQAKADRIYCEEYRKTLKAQLMQSASSEAVGAQERDAYAHPDYAAHLLALRAAVEAEETLRWRMVAAQARVEVWRSLESTARAEGRATQ